MLTQANMKNIEDLLKMPGVKVEIFYHDPEELDAGHKKKVKLGRRLVIRSVPAHDDEISFSPVLLNTEEATPLSITAIRPGEEPISIADVEVPAGIYVTGLKTKSFILKKEPA